MRLNEYKCLDDFVNEYDGKHEKGDEFHIGLDFKYKGIEYRMCHEPHDRRYHVTTQTASEYCEVKQVLHFEPNPRFPWLDYSDVYLIGTYDTIDDLLDAECIDNRPFRDVIMDDGTVMLGKD